MATLTYATSASRSQRRRALMASPTLKGLDSVAAEGPPVAGPGGETVWRLLLRFVPAAPETGKDPLPAGLGPGNVRILLEGTPDPYVAVQEVVPGSDGASLVAVVRKESPAIFPLDPPAYLLELVGLADLDPVFSAASFAFRPVPAAPGYAPRSITGDEGGDAYDVDYMAKDYESFRQLLLERMSFFVPDWQERNPSDLGVTIVEVLAYAADYLSYYQDSVATEAYLDTARRRTSVRRHTRLLDYHMIEGTNARVWVQIWVERAADGDGDDDAGFELPAGLELLTRTLEQNVVVEGGRGHLAALESGALVFQTMVPVLVHPDHDRLDLYTWGTSDFALPKGCTRAALRGHRPALRAGDVLVFEKLVTHRLEEGAPLDPRERQPVRLSQPPLLARDPLTGEAYTEIAWFDEDALAIDFPVSRATGRVLQERLSVVWGNIVPADHGERMVALLPPVLEGERYTPVLPRAGLAFRQPLDAAGFRDQPASASFEQIPWLALPQIELVEVPQHVHAELAAVGRGEDWAALRAAGGAVWRPRYDLLNSGRFARDFVVEMDEEGSAQLRFGDGHAGRRPPAGARFLARFRVGFGPRGNVGVHAIHHVVLTKALEDALDEAGLVVRAARNPLPGVGGNHAQDTTHAQVYAPDIIHSFAYQRRCVLESDYSEIAERHPEVRRAVARQTWSGNATTVVLYVQREDGLALDSQFEARLRRFLAPFLMAGCDLVLRDPLWVPLEIQVTLSLLPGVRAEAVVPLLLTASGVHRFFDSEGFTFGEPFYLSRLTALLMSVPGVADVRVDVFQRWGQPARGELAAGVIEIGPLEIVRIENSPAAPQHGTFQVRFEEEP